MATGWDSLNANAYTTGADAAGYGAKRPATITLSRVLFYICIKQLTLYQWWISRISSADAVYRAAD